MLELDVQVNVTLLRFGLKHFLRLMVTGGRGVELPVASNQ